MNKELERRPIREMGLIRGAEARWDIMCWEREVIVTRTTHIADIANLIYSRRSAESMDTIKHSTFEQSLASRPAYGHHV